MGNEAMGQMIPFVRSPEYLRKLALKQRGQGRPVRALELLRLSQKKASDDARTKIELAETYAAIHCPMLSNQVLFSLLDDEAHMADSFFFAGRNYIAMRFDSIAQDCLMMYLQKKPQGPHAMEAVELLEMIGQETPKQESMEERVNARINRVLTSLDNGKPMLAVRQIRRALALDRRNGGVHALRSFALLGAGDKKGALAAARKAMHYSQQNIRALCAMAISLKALGMEAAGRGFLLRATKRIEDEEDAQIVCQTACEMGEHQSVQMMLKELEQQVPYAVDLLHLLATASHNAGDTEEAKRCWRLICRINPMDTVAKYRLRRADQDVLEKEISYARQVPLLETLTRLSILRQWMQEGVDALIARWQESDELEQLLRWGLSSDEPDIPQAMLGILTMLSDRRAQQMLLDLLCDVNISNDVKHHALATLCVIGVKGPFYAIIGDRLTLVHVSKVEEWREDDYIMSLFESVKKRFDGLSDQEISQIRALCHIAARNVTPMGETFRMHGVELAMRLLRGERVASATHLPIRRKLERYAFHIMREYQKNAVH